jgi:hypothetical protein
MKRENLEHVLRASAEICEESEFCIIGSQAILSEHPNLNDQDIVRSVECDLYPENAPEKSELLNAIGELSPFHQQFGYYADGVGPETAVLPEGWKGRRSVIEVRTLRDARVLGWCLEPHDLLVSKYVAGREKDLTYCSAVIRLAIVSKETLKERLAATRVDRGRHMRILAFVDAAFEANDANSP